jgi:YesN/AraC family two-component response regulator
MTAPTALIADDEPLLRERLAELLAAAWPELQVVAQARNGRDAVDLFDRHAPDVVFLDVQMPGMNGIRPRAVLRAARTWCSSLPSTITRWRHFARARSTT